MSFIPTRVIAGGVALVTAFGAVVPSAQAGHRHNNGAAAAAIIFGLAAGVIAADAMAQQPRRAQYYYDDAPRRCWTERYQSLRNVYDEDGNYMGRQPVVETRRFCR